MILEHKNYVDGLNDCAFEISFGEHCVYGKQIHVQFYSSSLKYSMLLNSIHSNVFGHVKVPLNAKDFYYMSFIDDYYRRIHVYFV